jgi:hypothetical protein
MAEEIGALGQATGAGGGEGGGDNYSPYLSRLLKLNPQDVSSGNVSLLGLGRAAMGADTEEYRKVQEQVDAAQNTLNRALQARSTGLDPKFLALAEGLLNPGGGGGFFEGLGKGMKGYNAAANEEDKRQQDVAKMQLALAQAKRNEITQASQLGLSVSKSLAPKMTAYQNAVQSLGIDPNSPAGIAKIQEMMAMDKATPEMKAFAAQKGLELTSPDFTTQFNQDVQLKPLKETALRLNLDLTNPEHVGIAKREFNREKVTTQVSPELKKYLESFNGDVSNPKDMAKAANLMSQAQGLDVQSKQAGIAASRASTNASLLSAQRTLQEISENSRLGGTNIAEAKAKENGVPVPDTSRYAGMTMKEAAAQRVKDMDSTREYIEKNIAPGMSKVQDDIDLLKQAKVINARVPTGTVKAQFDTYRNFLSGNAADYQVLDKLSNRTLSGLKVEGDHNISNADRDFMKASTFSYKNVPEANNKIIDGMLAQRVRDKDYQEFVLKFAQSGGAVPEANQKFQQYVNANPIMVKSKTGDWVENPNRMTYQQYFSAPRKNYDKNGNPQP